MKVGLIVEYFPTLDGRGVTGGVEKRAWEIATRLARKHWVTVLASRQVAHTATEERENLKVFRVGRIHPYSNQGHILSRLLFCLAVLRSRKLLKGCNIVDCQNFTTYLPGYFCARSVGARAVATWHEVWLGSWIRHKGLVTGLAGELWEGIAIRRQWDAVVCVTEVVAQQVRRYTKAGTPIWVVPNGVDVKRIDEIPCISKHPGLVLYVGRLVPSKAVDVLIRAFHLVTTRHRELRDKLVQIIGDGPARPELERLVEDLSLVTRVRFRGRLESHEEVLRRIKEAELLVNPSTLEGFGIVLAEAAACRTPVIVSDIPAFREVLQYTKGGQFFPVGDALSLADALRNHFLVSPIEVGDAGHLDWNRIATSLEEAYKSLVRDDHDSPSDSKAVRGS